MKKRGDTMSLRIDGKKISSDIKEELKEQVKLLKEEGISVCLAVIQVGSDPASSVYVNNKKKACAYIGIESQAYELTEETTQEELLSLISRLNKDDHVNGILVQLPVPAHMDEKEIIQAISPAKDVDGFHPQSVGALSTRFLSHPSDTNNTFFIGYSSLTLLLRSYSLTWRLSSGLLLLEQE